MKTDPTENPLLVEFPQSKLIPGDIVFHSRWIELVIARNGVKVTVFCLDWEPYIRTVNTECYPHWFENVGVLKGIMNHHDN